MTALPDSEAATSFVLNALFSKTRRIASTTAAPSMIAPSTMLSGGTGSMASAATLKPLPTAFSSTALTALDPMSRPTTAFDLPKPNTVYVLTEHYRLTSRKAGTSLATDHTVEFRRLRATSVISNAHGLPGQLQ